MSLVDYESSSSDEENEDGEAAGRLSEETPPPQPPPAEGTAVAKPLPRAGPPRPTAAPQEPPPPGPDLPKRRSPVSSTYVQSGITSDVPSASVALPDASLLFSSPSFFNNQANVSDHSSRVAAAMAENALRKRASNGSVPHRQQIKHHKGVSSVPNVTSDAKGVELVPPQLRGRSNVVTEDIGKLFVHKRS
ncbi:unnamed protein product [Spirodela intermedia]|uniref:Uncharacterized protein n=1 Tax=Spirodela intermedia TaxID=51605 RepID=A0A7I8IWG1_SPIIN|nr:unnamed protein product [Spirodela intermedia]CAA6662150.1 unnamed protein product [Spirodela intermedia]